MAQSDKGLAKIAEGVSPRRHAETSPVKVKDTHLMNNKLPPAEILCGDWPERSSQRRDWNASAIWIFEYEFRDIFPKMHGIPDRHLRNDA